MGNMQYLLLIVVWFKVIDGKQINTTQCDKSFRCFRNPADCTSLSTCDWLITYEYNKTANTLNVQIGGKHKWIAFGLNSGRRMSGTSGHVCYKNGGSEASILAFSNSGYTPTFKTQIPGLTGVTTTSNPISCSFSRPINAPAGSDMKNLNQNWYLIVAYGNGFISNGSPSKHDATGISADTVDFKKLVAETTATPAGKSTDASTKQEITTTPAGNSTVASRNEITTTPAGNSTVASRNDTNTTPTSASTVFGSTTMMAIGLHIVLGLMYLA